MKSKIVTGIILTSLMLSMIILLAGKASLPPVIVQANPVTTTVYLDQPTINGTAIGVNNNVTVNINIRDANDIHHWQAGLTFNATLLNCTGFHEGEFLSDAGPTFLIPGTINNTAGMVRPPYMCSFLGEYNASGSGRLAYATFNVKAPGVSDIHLSDVKVLDYDLNLVPVNIIDVYTVVVDTTAHTVVAVSNSTDTVGGVPSGLYGHAFIPGEELRFNITGPHPGFSHVTIPRALMWVDALDDWNVTIDGRMLSTEERIVTYNDTHYSIYFMYSDGTHTIQITSPYVIPEFPTTTILLLFMFFTLIAVALTKKITIKRNSKEYSNPA